MLFSTSDALTANTNQNITVADSMFGGDLYSREFCAKNLDRFIRQVDLDAAIYSAFDFFSPRLKYQSFFFKKKK